ncbi:hypothetical protein B0H14DRAFT_2596702 [Mycena olivaceomarginata]|nr:hypothetical protein B0H14DRAFT_2596702 [Mycena olivaceomarginata]
MTEGVHVDVFDRNNHLSDVMPDRAVIPFDTNGRTRTETHTLTGPQYIPRGETNQATSNRRDIQVGMSGMSLINPAVAVEIFTDSQNLSTECKIHGAWINDERSISGDSRSDFNDTRLKIIYLKATLLKAENGGGKPLSYALEVKHQGTTQNY